MPLYMNCFRKLCGNLIAANDNAPPPQVVTVATDDQLRSISYFQRLAIVCADLMQSRGMSRREFLDWLAETVYFFHLEDGRRIEWPDGTPFPVHDCYIDDAFEPEGRWISYLVGFEGKLPAQKPQQRVLKRLRAIDLAVKIAFPDLAKHLGR